MGGEEGVVIADVPVDVVIVVIVVVIAVVPVDVVIVVIEDELWRPSGEDNESWTLNNLALYWEVAGLLMLVVEAMVLEVDVVVMEEFGRGLFGWSGCRIDLRREAIAQKTIKPNIVLYDVFES